jgi:hypothetical protein
VLEGLPKDADVLVDGEKVTVKRGRDEATITVARGGPHGLQVKLGDRELRTSDATVTVGGEPIRIKIVDYDPNAEPERIPPADGSPVPKVDAARDLFAVGTTWRGVRIVEHGQFEGNSGYYELQVRSRDGEKFTGQVFENGPNRNPCEVTGTIRGTAIEWTEVPHFAPTRIAKMSGTIDGAVMSVTFDCQHDGKFVNDGRGRLVRLPRSGESVPEDFVPIFDGRTLDAWETHPSQKGGWTVNQFGKLIGHLDSPATKHLYTRRADFTDVHIQARMKVNTGCLAGLCVRAGFGPAACRDLPDGYLALASGGAKDWTTGDLQSMHDGRAQPKVSAAKGGPQSGEWFDLDIIAVGQMVRVLVNGQESARLEDSAGPRRGRIALYLGEPGEVEIASLIVKELAGTATKSPADPKERRPKGDGDGAKK